MNKTPIAIALERQIPEHIREEYATFVQFVKAYYEFLEQTQQRNLEDIRSLDNTLDEFIFKFKKELSALFPSNALEDERFLLQRIREFYKSRGSEESFKFLFRAFFNKDAEIYYPSKQVLRASAGNWIQEKSIFLEAVEGKNLFDLNSRIITIVTARKHINVYSPRVRYYRAGIYEVFIDRAYVSDISIGETVLLNGIEYGKILPCPSKYTIVSKGSGFDVGSIHSLPSANGNGSVVKVTKINSSGGIEKIQPITFGLDYTTTFFAKLSSTYYKPLDYFHPLSSANIDESSPPTGFPNRNGLFPSADFNRTSGFYGDTTTGYLDYGYVIHNEYFAYQADYTGADNIVDLDPYFGFGDYVGEIIGEFYTNALNGAVMDSSIAQIMIDLGAVAIYPGYYNSTDGFISDEIYIQDGKYYQSYSYVIKVEEQLDSYVNLIKSLLHPAGFELFAQYSIKNDFIVSTVPLDAFVRYQFFDRVFTTDFSPIPINGILNIHQNKSDSVPTIDAFAPINYPTQISRYSALYSVDISGNLTFTTPTGTNNLDGYFSDYGLSAQIDRNQSQTSSLKNNWDIVLGNQNASLGTVAPLVADTVGPLGNFENRILGSVDTLGISKPASSTAISVDSLAPSGSPTNIKKYSVLLSVDSLGNTTIGTPTGVNGQLSDYSTTTESYVNGAFGSVSGLAWEFSGDTWKDTPSSVAYHDQSWSTAIVNGVPVPYDFKDRTFKLYSELLSVDSLGNTTIGTPTGVNGVFSKYVTSADYFSRSDPTSGSVTYNRSTIPLEETSVSSIDVKSSSSNPTNYKKYSALYTVGANESLTLGIPTGIQDYLSDYGVSSDSLTKLEFSKYKQPQLLGFTATITAGSKDLVFTTGFIVNTMIGLVPTKISGTGSFGSNALVDVVDTVNNKLVLSVAHSTSGTISFYITASSAEPEIADLAGTVTAVNGSGLNWEFAGSTYNQLITSSDVYASSISYNRSTIPLEETSITAINGGMNWNLGFFAFTDAVNFANTIDAISLKDINKTTSDTVDTVTSGINWEFGGTVAQPSGETFKDSSAFLWSSLQVSSAAHDFIFTSAVTNVWLKVATLTAASNEAEQLLMSFLNTYEGLALHQYQLYPSIQNGYKFGDLDENNDIGSSDALIILKYLSNVAITEAQTTKIQRLLGKISQINQPYLNTLIAGGLITSTKRINIEKGTSANPISDSTININNTGTLYYNPYNINTDASTVFSYTSESYFYSDTRALS